MDKPKRRKGESKENYEIRLEAYRRRFDSEKAPKLLKNESSSSFKARVKAWENATNKKYPKTFGGTTNEERVLKGEPRLRGLNISKDYSYEYLDEIKEYQRTKPKLSIEDRDEQQIADIASGKTDLSKVNAIPLNRQEIQISEAAKKLGKMDKERLDKDTKAENQEIRDTVKLQDEANPDSYDALARRFGLEIGRTSDVVSDQKGLLIQNPTPPPTPDKNKGAIGTIADKNPAATGTSLEKKFEKVYGKRKMKRFNQVYGKLNLSDRMKQHLLMSKAFRDM